MSEEQEILETKMAYLEHSLATLSDEFYRQQQELQALKRGIQQLEEKQHRLEQVDAVISDTNELPPHY